MQVQISATHTHKRLPFFWFNDRSDFFFQITSTSGCHVDLYNPVLYSVGYQGELVHMPQSQSARYLQVLSSYKDSKYQSTFAVIAHVGCRKVAHWIAHMPQNLQW